MNHRISTTMIAMIALTLPVAAGSQLRSAAAGAKSSQAKVVTAQTTVVGHSTSGGDTPLPQLEQKNLIYAALESPESAVAQRPNYFDGKLLSADDLNGEQQYSTNGSNSARRSNHFDGKLLTAKDLTSEQQYQLDRGREEFAAEYDQALKELQLKLQDYLQQAEQAFEELSNIVKTTHDATSATIRNIR